MNNSLQIIHKFVTKRTHQTLSMILKLRKPRRYAGLCILYG